MDFWKIATSLSHDLETEIPAPSELRSWRRDWTERALGEPTFKGSFSQLHAVEFFAKCQGLPGIAPQSQLDQFLSSQQRCQGPVSAPDRILDAVTDACRWLLRDYADGDAVRFCTHGPGATVDGLTSFDKWLMKLPSIEMAEQLDPLQRFPRTQSLLRLNRFSEVPKTSWAMRGICIEETAAQFLQQGIGRMLRFHLTFAGVDLRRQWRTNILKLRDPDYHTIDLSAASDSISTQLMKVVFVGPKLERWFEAMSSTRAEFCSIPASGPESLVRLNTFASMGNGFCFQLLSLICMACCIASIRETNRHFPWKRDRVLDEFHTHFSVYGDDIVAHERYRPALYYILASCGFKVNTEKSSTNGAWRESCGAYARHEDGSVRIASSVPRMKSLLLSTPDDYVSLCNLQRRCFSLGWSATAKSLVDEAMATAAAGLITRISTGDFNQFPNGLSDPFGSALVVVDPSVRKSITSWSKTRCRVSLPANVFTPHDRPLALGDLSATAACLLGGGLLPPTESYGKTCRLQKTRVYN